MEDLPYQIVKHILKLLKSRAKCRSGADKWISETDDRVQRQKPGFQGLLQHKCGILLVHREKKELIE